jgi:hypothetical protein
MSRSAIATATAAQIAFWLFSPASAADCPNMLHLHGYLTVAVAKCGFKEAPSVVNAASDCRAQLGHSVATQLARDGIRFAQGEMKAKGGVPSWCASVKGQYPSLISDASRHR